MKRFIWVSLCGVIFLAALTCFLFFELQLQKHFTKTREQLILIASNAARNISADEVFAVPLTQWSEGTPEYMVLFRKLEAVKASNPFVKFVYIMTSTVQPGILQYVVDADPAPEIITAHCPTALPGDKYDARNLPEMLGAFGGPAADKKITSDVWGVFISGYAPIRDTNGKAVAILGVDTDATLARDMQKNARTSGRIALWLGLLFLVSWLTLIKFPNKIVKSI